jgi:hypothetical protein
VALVLINTVSRIPANPLYHRKSVGLCNGRGPCKGEQSLCCSETAVLLCNDAGMLQSNNCGAGEICVDFSSTSARCQAADICESVGSVCSIETFESRCCADGTRFVACQNNELSIAQCVGSCTDDGNMADCEHGVAT